MKQVVVDISPAGSVKIEAIGFNGVGCAKATEQIEIAIGGSGKKSKKKKPEWNAGAGNCNSNKLTF